jgi:hypothetical protein
MSTRAQRAANRRNAQASTGPVTDAGKEVSSQNARTHGCSSTEFNILPEEDPNDFDRLIERISAEMRPVTEHESFLVGLMAQARWKRGRIQNHEMDLLDQLISGEPVEAKIALMMRYAANAERSYYKAHREFTQSRREREQQAQAALGQAIDNYIMAPPGQAPPFSIPLACKSASFGTTAATPALRL